MWPTMCQVLLKSKQNSVPRSGCAEFGPAPRKQHLRFILSFMDIKTELKVADNYNETEAESKSYFVEPYLICVPF